MKNFLRNNGLSLVLALLFMLFLAGQAIAGFLEYNDDQKTHFQQGVEFGEYLLGSHFWEATFENWESEFLQMSAYVVLTVFLFQKGSSESKDPDEDEEVDELPEHHRQDPQAPAAVRRGGWRLRLYRHSLSLTLFFFFLLSWTGHLLAGAATYNEERLEHGEHAVTVLQYLGSSRLWFESFQNWQSEFLAVLAIVVLSIRLREHGSPESKPVHAPHDQTGE